MSRVRLGDVAERLNIKVDQATTDLEFYIGGEHIESSEFITHQKAPIKGSTIGYQFQFGFRKGDVLFMTKNPHLRKCSMATFDGLCSIATFVIHTKSDLLLQDYLLFEMQSDRFWQYCEDHKSGGVNYFINWGTLSDYEFDLPSIEEQKVLAEKLWAAYKVKESYCQLLSTTDEILKAKFQEMFGDVDAPENGLPFEEVFEIRDNLRTPLNDTARSAMHEGDILYPYYGANGLVDRINQYKIDMDALCLAEDCGDFESGGNSAYIISGKSWVNNHAHILIPRDNCLIEYAQMLFKIMDITKFVDNDNRPKLTQSNMKKIKILLPSLVLQQQFVDIATQAEATKASLRASIKAIDRVIRSLINQ